MGRPKKDVATATKDTKESNVKRITLTAEDLELNPEYVAQGYAVGDTVEVEDAEGSSNSDIEDAQVSVPQKPKKGAKSVDVINGETYIRTYSEAVHGEDFNELAQEFISTRVGYTIVDSESIKSLVVHFRSVDEKSGRSFDSQRVFNSKEGAIAFAAQNPGAYIVIKK